MTIYIYDSSDLDAPPLIPNDIASIRNILYATLITGYGSNTLSGSLLAWGLNDFGQLGDGTTTGKSSPVAVAGGGSWIAVSSGAYHSLRIKSDGTLFAWGRNSNGQLGDNSTTNKSSPVAVAGGGSWIAVSGGAYHSLGIKSDGSLWAWGENGWGQLGDSTITNKSSLVAVSGGGSWIAVSCGGSHSLGIKADGSLWAWGRNSAGQLGDNTTANKSSPIAVSNGGSWIAVSCGTLHSLGIKTDGSIWAWGENGGGQLGDNTRTNKSSPVAVAGGGSWIAVSGGYYHSLGIKSDGTLWAWGWNGYGQLGNSSTTTKSSPVAISGGGSWIAVSGGIYHSIGIKSDGSLWAWGRNNFGQLGDNSTTNTSSPVAISGGGSWIAVSSGRFHSVGIKSIGGGGFKSPVGGWVEESSIPSNTKYIKNNFSFSCNSSTINSSIIISIFLNNINLVPNYLGIFKSNSFNSTPVSWLLITDGNFIYFFTDTLSNYCTYMTIFGNYFSLINNIKGLNNNSYIFAGNYVNPENTIDYSNISYCTRPEYTSTLCLSVDSSSSYYNEININSQWIFSDENDLLWDLKDSEQTLWESEYTPLNTVPNNYYGYSAYTSDYNYCTLFIKRWCYTNSNNFYVYPGVSNCNIFPTISKTPIERVYILSFNKDILGYIPGLWVSGVNHRTTYTNGQIFTEFVEGQQRTFKSKYVSNNGGYLIEISDTWWI